MIVMIVVLIVVVLVIIGIVVAVRSKGASSSDDFLRAERPHAATGSSTSTSAPAERVAEPTPQSAPAEPAPVDVTPDDRTVEPVAPHEVDLASLVFDDRLDAATAPDGPIAEPASPRHPDAPVAAPDPTPESDRPEPMVRARISTSSASSPSSPAPEAASPDDDDRAVLSRFQAPGARVASIGITPIAITPIAPVVAPPEELASPETAAAMADPEPVGDPITDLAPDPETDAAPLEPVVDSELPPEQQTATELVLETGNGTDTEVAPLVSPTTSETVEPAFDPETVEPALDPETVEPAFDPETVAPAFGSDPEPSATTPLGTGDDSDGTATPSDDGADVERDAPAAVTGAAGMSAVLEDPIVLTDDPALPVARLQPEPELDPVDHVLKALISRAKDKQVGIAEVAAELVEQANLEDRDIDEVLADLVVRADDDQVDSSERLEELTLFNDSVPRRPGQLTDFDRLDKNARKKVIIRVLCLLVAMQEDNRLKPSEPRSEAETRHWPLARAVWPVPAADEGDGDDADGDKKLPGRRLARTSTKR